ncbi:MAG: hypothetical protein L0I62_03360 [Gammaproteobacteria bacterium]|nr:hypothetical protein [Gammaproteobacteria bacterium]
MNKALFFAIAMIASTLGFAPHDAQAADYTVYSPNVVLGESELEARGFHAWGTDPGTGAEQALRVAFGHAFTDWWATEFYAVAEQEFGESFKLEEFEWENRFQLMPQGKYWISVGLISEVEIPRFGDDPWEVKFGPILSKDFGRFTALLNILFAHEYGANAESGVEVAYRARLQYRWRRAFSPLIEAYGQPVGKIGAWGGPRHQIGPGVTGKFGLGPGESLRYGAVLLFGASGAAADTTLVFRLEYEFF